MNKKKNIFTVLFALIMLLLTSMASYSVILSNASTMGSPVQTIKLVSYSGNDEAALAALKAGEIQMYAYGITAQEESSLGSGFNYLSEPNTLYDILFNPTNTTFGFNPFMFQQVRFAMNFVVDRSYFVQQVLGGNGIPSLTPYAGEQDALTVSNVTSAYSYIHYNLTYANETIYKVLTAHGAVMKNGQWFYNGKPITIYVFYRTDTTFRAEYTKFLESQLEKLGFTVQEVPGTLSKVISLVYGSDPVNSTWDILVEAWGGVYGYYDEGLAESFYSPFFGNMPVTDSQSLSWGAFNDSKYETPGLIKASNLADKYSLALANTNYSSFLQRDQLLSELVALGLNQSVRVFLGGSLSAYPVSPQMQGVIPNFVEGPLNLMTFINVQTPNGTAVIGVRHLSEGSWNPIAGFTDSYTDEIGNALTLPASYGVSGTGYPEPLGITFTVLADSPSANYTLPSGSLNFNPVNDSFYSVTGMKAKTAVIVNFANYMESTKWADGQPVTLADLIYQYVIGLKVATDPNSSIYDSFASSVYSTALQQIVGFKVINSTSLEIFSSAWYPDKFYDAQANAIGDFLPLGYALPGGNMFPWQLYAAMASVVSSGKAAWSSSVANQKGIDWLSVVSPTDVGYITQALNNLSKEGYVPKSLIQLQQMTGAQLINSTQAMEGYTAALSFINKYGNAMISDGPYILVQYSTSSSPHFAILQRNPYFNISTLSYSPLLNQEPLKLSLVSTLPPTVYAGQNLYVTGTVLGTPEGSNTTSPVSGASVIVQMVSSGKVVYTMNTTTSSSGTFNITVPGSYMAANNSYQVVVYYYTPSTILINPMTFETVAIAPPPMTTTTTPSTTTTTPTSSGISTTSIVAIVIVVIIVIAVVAVVLRRR